MELNNLIEACYSLANERKLALEKTKTKEEHIKCQEDTLHFYRTQLEPYVFNYLSMKYGSQLEEFWKTHQFPKKSKYAFIMVERRCHTNWWFVLRNIAWAAPHFSLYIFCSDLNYDFIRSVLGDKAENVHIIQCFKGIADRRAGYLQSSILVQAPIFYKSIDAEWCINVHLDAYFLQKIPDWIFTGTYYGAPWGWNPTRAGNGGLSIRNIPNMIDLCQREVDNVLSDCADDVYICNALEKHGFEIPPFDFRVKVFQENFPTPYNVIGTHQFWTYIHNYNMSDKAAFTENIKKLVTIIGI
jgi:hypothetical protein